jgi:glycerol-3-phosphate dehydrogenase
VDRVVTGQVARTGASLNAARRDRELAAFADAGRAHVDLLVIGGGVTGTGVALDAAARGLSVVLAERGDLAQGTSRWSSKLVHGGLRYLAHGDFRIAHESAVERGRIMTIIAPHLTRALPMVLPELPSTGARSQRLARAGFAAGDVLRRLARTDKDTLPGPRRLGRAEVLAEVPAIRRDVLGGLLSWDGQLTDDAALVVAIARTAAAHGASILTRCQASELSGDGATLTDALTGSSLRLSAGAVINAAGVWAGQLVPGVVLQPSRGTHLVLRAAALPGLNCGILAPVPGERARYVFALPVPGDQRIYVGLTDEPQDGPVPDVPEPTAAEIAFLLETISGMLDVPLGLADVAGAFAGLRPLLQNARAGAADQSRPSRRHPGPALPGQRHPGPAWPGGATADLSRRHAVLTSPDGVITIVGGKLTTYRQMAQDAVDAALKLPGLARRTVRPCTTMRLPLVGAAPPPVLARIQAPARLVARYGTEAPDVLALGDDDPRLLDPVAEGLSVTGAELIFALRHEGALDADDLLDRRTRIGLVSADRDRVLLAARQLLAAAGISRS